MITGYTADRRTDTVRRHKPRLNIASRGKNGNSYRWTDPQRYWDHAI